MAANGKYLQVEGIFLIRLLHDLAMAWVFFRSFTALQNEVGTETLNWSRFGAHV